VIRKKKFREGAEPAEANKSGWKVDETRFDELSVDEKALTGMGPSASSRPTSSPSRRSRASTP